VAELYRLPSERKLTQAKAGALMGISQPEVSRLFKGKFREYSIDRLMAFLTAFDPDAEIVSRPRPRSTGPTNRGRVTFKSAAA
jgi:predicted XRE-type DNA-binding protein